MVGSCRLMILRRFNVDIENSLAHQQGLLTLFHVEFLYIAMVCLQLVVRALWVLVAAQTGEVISRKV